MYCLFKDNLNCNLYLMGFLSLTFIEERTFFVRFFIIKYICFVAKFGTLINSVLNF